jgi:hypothetical protein
VAFQDRGGEGYEWIAEDRLAEVRGKDGRPIRVVEYMGGIKKKC